MKINMYKLVFSKAVPKGSKTSTPTVNIDNSFEKT